MGSWLGQKCHNNYSANSNPKTAVRKILYIRVEKKVYSQNHARAAEYKKYLCGGSRNIMRGNREQVGGDWVAKTKNSRTWSTKKKYNNRKKCSQETLNLVNVKSLYLRPKYTSGLNTKLKKRNFYTSIFLTNKRKNYMVIRQLRHLNPHKYQASPRSRLAIKTGKIDQ